MKTVMKTVMKTRKFSGLQDRDENPDENRQNRDENPDETLKKTYGDRFFPRKITNFPLENPKIVFFFITP